MPTNIIEVLIPAVDTPWHKGNPPQTAIFAKDAVKDMLNHLGKEKEKQEIKVAKVKKLYFISRIAPKIALKIESI